MKSTVSLLLSLSLAGYASACLRASAHISASAGQDALTHVSVTDNGVATCDGSDKDKGGSGDIKCIDGYMLHYEVINNGVRCYYGTPHGNFQFDIKEDKTCRYSNCCEGSTPCSCSQCDSYQHGIFGC